MSRLRALTSLDRRGDWVARNRFGLCGEGAVRTQLFSTLSGSGKSLRHAKRHRCIFPAVTSAMPYD
jgi:hypothetical protein